MKSLIIFLSVVAVVSAGVGVVTPEVEAEALRLWQQFCDGASDGGEEGNVQVFCKRARGAMKISLQHQVNIGSKDAPKDQVVFIQPAPHHYKHDVIVSGGAVAARKTVIYVKPSLNKHEVNIVDQTQPAGEAAKPQLFFLKGNHGSETEIGSQPQPPPVVTTPPNTYLPPTTTTPPPATYLPPSQTTPGYNYPAPSRQLAYLK